MHSFTSAELLSKDSIWYFYITKLQCLLRSKKVMLLSQPAYTAIILTALKSIDWWRGMSSCLRQHEADQKKAAWNEREAWLDWIWSWHSHVIYKKNVGFRIESDIRMCSIRSQATHHSLHHPWLISVRSHRFSMSLDPVHSGVHLLHRACTYWTACPVMSRTRCKTKIIEGN